MKLLINFTVFQVGWFTSVIAAAENLPWLGPVAVTIAVALHLKLARHPAVEFKLIALAMGFGLLLDSLLLSTGWLSYSSGLWIPGLAPYWIMTLWALFATTLNVSMRFLRGQILLSVLFGAIGGPLSYLAGAQLGAMSLDSPAFALIALAVSWSIAMPLLICLSSRLDGVRSKSTPPYVTTEWNIPENA